MIEGYGLDAKSDTMFYFAGDRQFFDPVDMSPGVANCAWEPWPWGWWGCPLTECCRLKTIAICTGIAIPAPCGPPRPFCELRTQPFAAGWITWCICPNQPAPPPPGGRRCMFQIFVKCKEYPCFYPCVCEVAQCPWPRRFIQVPFTNRAMKNACKRMCEYP